MPDQSAFPLPPMLYGTAWKKERTTELVLKAYRMGFRGFDTACQPKHYAEARAGEALKMLAAQGIQRGDYYLQSKYSPPASQDPESIPYDSALPVGHQVAQSFRVSLVNLATDYLDALILHTPFAEMADTLQAWQAMEATHDAGGARRLGISNCYDLAVLQELYAQARIKPAIVQNRFYHETGYDVAIRTWCREQGITYQSFWTLTANAHLLEHRLMQMLAQKYGKTPAQTLFTWLHQRKMVPLTGTTSEQHMREDLAAFATLMSEAELSELDALLTASDE